MNDKEVDNKQVNGTGDENIKKKNDDEEKKKNRKKLLILFGIAIGAAIILIAIFLLFTFCKKNEAVKESVAETHDEQDEEIIETEEPDDTDISEEPVPEDEEDEPDEEEIAIAPTVSILTYYGPIYSPEDAVCYYRIVATVTGTPEPDLEWNQDDASSGSFGPYRIQINLNDPSDTVNLIATVTNTAGSDDDTLILSWSCNRPPTIDDIVLSGDLYIEETYPISAVADDLDGDILTYFWSTSGGSIIDPGINPTNWLTPSYGGFYSVTITVDDGRGGTGSKTETFEIMEPNNPPAPGEIIIKEIPGGYPAYDIFTDDDYALDISAFDPDGDPLDYYWEVSSGYLENAFINPAVWTTPYSAGFVDITVTVDDGRGGITIRNKRVEVKYKIY